MRTVFGKQTHQILDRLELVFARDSEQVVDPEQHSLGDIVARALRQGVNFALVVLSVAPHGHKETIDKTSVHRVIRREQLRLERFRRRVFRLGELIPPRVKRRTVRSPRRLSSGASRNCMQARQLIRSGTARLIRLLSHESMGVLKEESQLVNTSLKRYASLERRQKRAELFSNSPRLKRPASPLPPLPPLRPRRFSNQRVTWTIGERVCTSTSVTFGVSQADRHTPRCPQDELAATSPRYHLR